MMHIPKVQYERIVNFLTATQSESFNINRSLCTLMNQLFIFAEDRPIKQPDTEVVRDLIQRKCLWPVDEHGYPMIDNDEDLAMFNAGKLWWRRLGVHMLEYTVMKSDGWEHYSGSCVYPVPHPDCPVESAAELTVQTIASNAYHTLPYWEGEYGKLRRSLAKYWLERLKTQFIWSEDRNFWVPTEQTCAELDVLALGLTSLGEHYLRDIA